ncbi:MAG: toll/interleukin-1 receptor domain-containing protein [Lentisphaerae bacterium]|nr:toll/interleukin-1 receptor domain-containing protein [Lentisphaerota bacterium]
MVAFLLTAKVPTFLGWILAVLYLTTVNQVRRYRRLVQTVLGLTVTQSRLEEVRSKHAEKVVFISYNRQTAEYARVLWQRLKTLGVPTWFGESVILTFGRKELKNENILRMILAHGISVSKHCILLVSPTSLTSEWVMDVETWLFKRKERQEGRICVHPVVVGNWKERPVLPPFLKDRKVHEWRDHLDCEEVVCSLLTTLDLKDQYRPPTVSCSRMMDRTYTVYRLNGDNRSITLSFIALDDWKKTAQERTPGGLHGRRFSRVTKGITVAHIAHSGLNLDLHLYSEMHETIEEDMAVLELPDIVEKQNDTFSRFGIAQSNIIASHLFNIDSGLDIEAQGNNQFTRRPHFAVTYRHGGLFYRKYILIVGPWSDGVCWEFEFTTWGNGPIEHFFERVVVVDEMVSSFRIHSLTTSPQFSPRHL